MYLIGEAYKSNFIFIFFFNFIVLIFIYFSIILLIIYINVFVILTLLTGSNLVKLDNSCINLLLDMAISSNPQRNKIQE